MNEEYGPVWIGVEEDGLNEWIKQPLRHARLKQGAILPVKPMRAPRNKFGFIRGMQPFFEAGEVEFAKPLPALADQLLGFPYGKIDAPNALAYALLMRPGAAIYPEFGQAHIAERVHHDRTSRLWLACNATRGLVVAAALQSHLGRIRVLADWALEDEPQQAVPLIVRECGMLFRASPVACCGPSHYDRYMNVGLVQALQRVPLEVERGADPARGREALRAEFGKLARGEPAVQVATQARLTLNALAGGYCRAVNKAAGIADEAESGLYRLLMEGVESCLGRAVAAESVMAEGNWHTSDDGRRYLKYGSAHQRRV